ncbi:MAG TPA: hypothetical protein VFS76_15660 [Pyrinomonadaceae bacterium]|nr:hypothetical protein [Pyrinomonadaceae bacterium]
MPLGQQILASFSRARYAAWADDVEHCRQLLAEIRNVSSKLDNGAYGLIFRAANQLSERLTGPDNDQSVALSDSRLIITRHLRAVIHRIADFEFEVRAYLDDLSWEESLYKRVTSIAAERSARPIDVAQKQDASTFEGEKRLRRPSASWRMVDRDLVCDILVGPFGLIKMKGTWISIKPPRQIDQVRATFEMALNEIDLDVRISSPSSAANTHLT